MIENFEKRIADFKKKNGPLAEEVRKIERHLNAARVFVSGRTYLSELNQMQNQILDSFPSNFSGHVTTLKDELSWMNTEEDSNTFAFYVTTYKQGAFIRMENGNEIDRQLDGEFVPVGRLKLVHCSEQVLRLGISKIDNLLKDIGV